MKKIGTAVAFAVLLASCQGNEKTQEQRQHSVEEHQHSSAVPAKNQANEGEQKKPLSPHTSAMAMVGDAHIHIDYSSPRVRNRIVFGGLVALDEVWVSGAHNATWLEADKALRIAGNELPAGKYALFTIPGEDQWTVIFNRNWEQHGKDEYKQSDDVFRFKVEPETLQETKEELTYEVNKQSDRDGTISLAWEKKKISFPFEVIQ
ncbi:DUF2911 domain-containing protein [Nafulsella turpanensis]|uniref:DUF2911 domain-containing protein n=1 Tax=Nafulsella turpanensis TaxID=1265690 RepID=UPI00034C5CB1|nr:DUF2911 domain-containing protein [Nafulsella turpanensis]